MGDKRHGKGIEYNKEGKKRYEGDWREDMLHGTGTFFFFTEEGKPEGRHVGEWFEGQRYGKGIQYLHPSIKFKADENTCPILSVDKDGYIVIKKGDYTDSEWVYGMQHGKIIQVHNGKKLVREFAYDKCMCEACKKRRADNKEETPLVTLYYDSKTKKYEGQIAKNAEGKDVRQGYGIEYFREEGKTYKGGFKDDKYHGKGSLDYDNGMKYIGDFKNGVIHGIGTLYYANGEKWFTGEYYKGKAHGKGIYYFSPSNKTKADKEICSLISIDKKGYIKVKKGDFIEGEWYDDQRHGTAKAEYRNGKKIKRELNFGRCICKKCVAKRDVEYRQHVEKENTQSLLKYGKPTHNWLMMNQPKEKKKKKR